MNKKVLFFFILLITIIAYIFKIDKIIVIEVTTNINKIKLQYKKYYETTNKYISRYVNQINTIQELQNQTTINDQYKLKYLISRYELEKLQNILLTTSKRPNIKYVEVLSYSKLNDFSKIILNTNEKIGNNILALATKNGQSAGIVLQEDNQIVSYLNQNPKCNYAVFIGKNKAPGMTSGSLNNNNNIIINHIPKWYKINIDDKVVTSGMDEIFPKGLKVGKVIKIQEKRNTQTAIISSYEDVLKNNYFYIIKK